MCLIGKKSKHWDSALNKSISLWWRFFAAYDQTVDHTPQARKIMGQVKITIRKTVKDTRFLHGNSNQENHREEVRKSTIICGVQELQGFSVPGSVLGFLDQKEEEDSRLSRRERLYMLHLSYVYGGR